MSGRNAVTGESSGELATFVTRSAGLQPWRRVFHVACGLSIVSGVLLLDPSREVVLLVLAGVLGCQLLLDLVRLAVPGANVWFFRSFAALVTPREMKGIASSTWYTLGALIAFALFPRGAAIGGIMVLAFADPAANLVGRIWGRVSVGRDGTVEGTAAFFVAAFGVLLFLTDPLPAVLAAAGATVIERTPLPLDDNLTIPLAAGAVLWMVGGA